MRRTVDLAARHGVAAGAHPGFPDLGGFGRRRMAVSPEEVRDLVTYQVGALMGFAAAAGVRVRHVKPHGALYTMAMDTPSVWEAIAIACAEVDAEMVLVGLAGPGSEERRRAGSRHGVRVALEYFADRGYRPDGTLIPRSQPGAVLHDAALVTERLLGLVRDGRVATSDGASIELEADTVCLHGDNPRAVELAGSLRRGLLDAGVRIEPFHEHV
jgi:UPF0271 protein